MAPANSGQEKTYRTVCMICSGHVCGIKAHVKSGVLTKVEPADFPDPRYRHICLRGLCTPGLVDSPNRPRYPMKRAGARGEGKWQRISWDEALDTVAAKFKEIADKYGPHSVAWLFGGGGGILSTSPLRLASTTGGTYIKTVGPGDAAGCCGDFVTYGSRFGESHTTRFEDPRLCIIWGGNYAETFIHRQRAILAAREKGARIVVVDPRFTPTAAKADEWLPIRPGTDAALALGMMNVVMDRKLQDEPFIRQHTVGPFLVRADNGLFLRAGDVLPGSSPDAYVVWDTAVNSPQEAGNTGVVPALTGSYSAGGIECKPAFQLLAELAAQYPPEKASKITGVDPHAIRRLAVEYATNKPAASHRSFGLQRTFHGDLSFRAVATLAAITGNINPDRPADTVLAYDAFFGRPRGPARQFPVLEMYQAALNTKPYPFKAIWVSRENWINQFPGFNRLTREILPRFEFIVYADIFMNASADYADMVLPLTTFFESTDLINPRPTFGGPPFVQLQQKAIEPMYECRTEFDIMTSLARRMGAGEYFNKSAEEFLNMSLSSGDPSMKGVTLDGLKNGEVKEPPAALASFATPSKRIEFYSERLYSSGEALPVFKEPLEGAGRPVARKYPLALLTPHTRFREQSLFADAKWLRELDPEPTLEMNAEDASRRAIKDGDLVLVSGERGKMKAKVIVHQGIKPGVVNMNQGWWPRDFVEGHHQELSHDAINQVQQTIWEANAAYFDVAVEVQKVEAK